MVVWAGAQGSQGTTCEKEGWEKGLKAPLRSLVFGQWRFSGETSCQIQQGNLSCSCLWIQELWVDFHKKGIYPQPLGDGVLQRNSWKERRRLGLPAHPHCLFTSNPGWRIRSQPLPSLLEQGSSCLAFFYVNTLWESENWSSDISRGWWRPKKGCSDAVLPSRASARMRQQCSLLESARCLPPHPSGNSGNFTYWV